MSGKTEIRRPGDPVKLIMAKFDGIVTKALLTVSEKENELTLVFADNRFLFVTLEGGKLKSVSVPE
ncbi:MAG: hypothetical protein LYZ70_02210 [Nitrososphaerales archaeon]|nr:hypothetical protein [Nitrososphaerales archaeon]